MTLRVFASGLLRFFASNMRVRDWTRVRHLLDQAVRDKVTPGVQCSVCWRDKQLQWQSAHLVSGALSYEPSSALVTVDTCYDLASVTKALVALSWVTFAEREGLSLATLKAEECWPRSKGTHAGQSTIDQLLSHRSELAAWCPMFESTSPMDAGSPSARESVFSRLFAEPIEPNGLTVRYSDLGYITVGEALAGVSGVSLATVVRERVLEPLGLQDAMQFHPVGEAQWAQDEGTAPTEVCSWRGRTMRGHVHDENAYALGGVCGHAGLFGTAKSLAELGMYALQVLNGDGDKQWMSPEAMQSMVAVREGGSHRLGWDGKSAQGSSAGTHASAKTFGHLGFTGTMLWCDPSAQIAVSLVSNRVHPSRKNQGIRVLRPQIMDAVIEILQQRPREDD